MKNAMLIILCLVQSIFAVGSSYGRPTVSPCANTRVKRVGFVIKYDDRKAEKIALSVAQAALQEGCTVVFADESRELYKEVRKASQLSSSRIHLMDKRSLPENTDFIVVIGGDGTLLSIARLMIKKSVPLLGINAGHLGFLTAIDESQAVQTVRAMIQERQGRIRISNRTLCDVSLYRNNRKVFQGLALNDAVITKGAISRVIGLEIAVNGCKAYDMRGDGLIVSTPTGSTAYSLSAGGPLVFPGLDAFVLSPICPHALTQRPVVLPDTCEIKIRITQRPGHVFLTLDGQDAIDLQQDDIVMVNRFHNTVQLMQPAQHDYFALVRDKLHFASAL